MTLNEISRPSGLFIHACAYIPKDPPRCRSCRTFDNHYHIVPILISTVRTKPARFGLRSGLDMSMELF